MYSKVFNVNFNSGSELYFYIVYIIYIIYLYTGRLIFGGWGTYIKNDVGVNSNVLGL